MGGMKKNLKKKKGKGCDDKGNCGNKKLRTKQKAKRRKFTM